MNIKTLVASTTLSIIFGMYSICGLMSYLKRLERLEKSYKSDNFESSDKFERLEKYYKDEIDSLKKSIIDINQKYEETNKKYYELLNEFKIIKNNFEKIETNKVELISCYSPPNYDNSNTLDNINESDKIVCDAIIDINSLNLEGINLFNDNEEIEEGCSRLFINSVEINQEDYVFKEDKLIKNIEEIKQDNDDKELKEDKLTKNVEEHEFEILEQGFSNNEHLVKSRARGTSISDINWASATKKFIFG